uniref:Uncharacterized protein n=1 Tax=Anguilla anguilla TaxID=7936 RepID=A0A0E9Q6S8_ANGAN
MDDHEKRLSSSSRLIILPPESDSLPPRWFIVSIIKVLDCLCFSIYP